MIWKLTNVIKFKMRLCEKNQIKQHYRKKLEIKKLLNSKYEKFLGLNL